MSIKLIYSVSAAAPGNVQKIYPKERNHRVGWSKQMVTMQQSSLTLLSCGYEPLAAIRNSDSRHRLPYVHVLAHVSPRGCYQEPYSIKYVMLLAYGCGDGVVAAVTLCL